jgi:hypothetical protein
MAIYTNGTDTIEAIQWTGHNLIELEEFTQGNIMWENDGVMRDPEEHWKGLHLKIIRDRINHDVSFGDYVVKLIDRDDFYSYNKEVFEKLYTAI